MSKLLSDEKIKEILIPIFIKQEQASIHWPDIFEEVRAIEAAVLEELAKQKPVAWMHWYKYYDCTDVVKVAIGHATTFNDQSPFRSEPLYAAPVVQPQQEPVGKPHRWNDDGERCLDCGDKDWMADKYCSAAPVVQPDMVRLYDDITEVVAKQLHYFDNVEKINGATTAKEVFDVLEGGIDRYRNDTVFHAKVCSLVAHLKQVIAATEKGKEEWAQHILRFCADAEVVGSPTRETPCAYPTEMVQQLQAAAHRARKEGK